MYVRLYADNKIRLFQAGAAWEEQPLSFYYLQEQQVDIAMKKVMIANLERA